MTRRRRILAGLAAAMLVALPAGWYLGSPWWTVWRMREAAQAGDVARLAGYVDTDALRRQAKRELNAGLATLLADARAGKSGRGRGFEHVLRKLEEAVGEEERGIVELRSWLADMPIRFLGWGGGGAQEAYLVRHGLDVFEVRREGTSLATGPMLTFRRHGLGWKLEAVRRGRP